VVGGVESSVYNNMPNMILPNIGGPQYNRNMGVLISYLLRYGGVYIIL
jgi:hypothetical protein